MPQISVTKEQVAENMQDVVCRTEMEFDKPVCCVTVRMKNGFTLRESTTCVDPSAYDIAKVIFPGFATFWLTFVANIAVEFYGGLSIIILSLWGLETYSIRQMKPV